MRGAATRTVIVPHRTVPSYPCWLLRNMYAPLMVLYPPLLSPPFTHFMLLNAMWLGDLYRVKRTDRDTDRGTAIATTPIPPPLHLLRHCRREVSRSPTWRASKLAASPNRPGQRRAERGNDILSGTVHLIFLRNVGREQFMRQWGMEGKWKQGRERKDESGCRVSYCIIVHTYGREKIQHHWSLIHRFYASRP